jgi:hypothetical protein
VNRDFSSIFHTLLPNAQVPSRFQAKREHLERF